MKPARWVMCLLFVVSLPGCRGCERNDRIMRDQQDPGMDETDPGSETVGGGGVVGWTPPEQGMAGIRSFTLAAVHAADTFFRIDAGCGDRQDGFAFDGSYGCLSSPAVSAHVTRVTGHWFVYEVVETRGSSTRTYFVSDPLNPPGDGCSGCSRQRSDEITPKDRATHTLTTPEDSKEEVLPLVPYGIRLDWQVIPAPRSGEPQWSGEPIYQSDGLMVSTGSPSVDLCRPVLERMSKSSAKSFVVGIRLSQAGWPPPVPSPPLESVLWSDPLPMSVVRKQLGLLKDGPLPVDPGVAQPPDAAERPARDPAADPDPAGDGRADAVSDFGDQRFLAVPVFVQPSRSRSLAV